MTKLLLSLALALLALPCQAAPSPDQIIEHFFGPDPGPNRADAYTGETKERYTEEPTISQMLLPGRYYAAKRLASSPADAPIYDVTVDNGHGKFQLARLFRARERRPEACGCAARRAKSGRRRGGSGPRPLKRRFTPGTRERRCRTC